MKFYLEKPYCDKTASNIHTILLIKSNQLMNLIDKRFWILEAFTLLYAIGLTALGCVVWDKTATIELGLFLSCVCLISGLITWLIADGKHWFVFGLVYEALFLCLIATSCVIAAVVTNGTIFNDFWLDIGILLVFIFTIGVVSLLPAIALAFFGYHIFRRSVGTKEDDKN